MKNKKGFTLIELLIVIAIVAIIAAITIPNIKAAMDKKKQKKIGVVPIEQAVKQYREPQDPNRRFIISEIGSYGSRISYKVKDLKTGKEFVMIIDDVTPRENYE
jgi:prepilin-type N-terminal cleavage/methylation domain-containing protein